MDEAALTSLFHADAKDDAGAARGAPQLSDGDVSERADRIMRSEPVAKTTPACAVPAFTQVGHAAHGTNLAAALSALRNTNAQLVPIKELGSLRGTGATPEQYLDGSDEHGHSILTEVVFAADLLHFGGAAVETAEKYARSEAGIEGKMDGTTTIRRSEASLIPVVLLGDLADPNGKGVALNKHFQAEPTQEVANFMGKTIAEVKEAFATQIIGERMKIRSIFVAHPTDPGQDGTVLELAKELVRKAAAEQGHEYSGIRVGLLHGEVAAFKRTHAGKRVVTHADLRALL